jgi:hypothetical protein
MMTDGASEPASQSVAIPPPTSSATTSTGRRLNTGFALGSGVPSKREQAVNLDAGFVFVVLVVFLGAIFVMKMT